MANVRRRFFRPHLPSRDGAPVVPSIDSSGRVALDRSRPAAQHPGMIWSFLGLLISAFKTRRELALENLALRQQLAVLHRSIKRPRLSDVDRGFWVILRRIWTDWERDLVMVKRFFLRLMTRRSQPCDAPG